MRRRRRRCCCCCRRRPGNNEVRRMAFFFFLLPSPFFFYKQICFIYIHRESRVVAGALLQECCFVQVNTSYAADIWRSVKCSPALCYIYIIHTAHHLVWRLEDVNYPRHIKTFVFFLSCLSHHQGFIYPLRLSLVFFSSWFCCLFSVTAAFLQMLFKGHFCRPPGQAALC